MLHYATYKDKPAAVRALLDYVERYQANPESSYGTIVFSKTLSEWVNAKIKGPDGFTALHYAAFNGNIKVIRLLIEKGADVRAVNPMGMSVMHVAA